MLTIIIRQLVQVFTWFVVVAPWEQAIRVRLGKRTQLMVAGVYFRLPFIDRIFKQSVRRRVGIVTPQTLTTLDGRIVTIGGAVGFEITDLCKFYNTLESPNDTITNEVCGLVSRFIGRNLFAECTAPNIEAFVMANLNLKRYGLSSQEFFVTQFAATKTYRLISGEIPAWSKDGQLSMAESLPHPPL